MQNHLNALIRKHRKIDDRVSRAAALGARIGAHEIRELKKLRLRLKDRINALQRDPAGPQPA